MNKRKSSQKSFSNFEAAFFILVAIALVAAGVNFAVVKNEQVSLDRKIEKARQEVKRIDMETQSEQVQIDRRTDRFVVKLAHQEMESEMVERPDYVVERVNPIAPPLVSIHQAQVEFPNLFNASGLDSSSSQVSN